MGNFDKKIDRFLEIFLEQNGYVTVLEGLKNTLMIAVIGLIIGILIGILCIRLFWVPVVHVLITFLTYSYYYNYDQPDRIIIPYSVLAIAMLGIVLFMTYQMFTYQEKRK